MGDSGSNTFAFVSRQMTAREALGNIQGGGSSTLDYSDWSVGPRPSTSGTALTERPRASGGSVSGITAIIGSNNAGDNILDAGTVPDVTLTGAGGLGTNTLSGTGAGDSVVESIGSSYTLTDSPLAREQFDGSTAIVDYLGGIRVANLVGHLGNSNSFNVSGWTGTGSLTVPAGSVGTVTASKNANFDLDERTCCKPAMACR